jgi:CBS domain-containing protein
MLGNHVMRTITALYDADGNLFSRADTLNDQPDADTVDSVPRYEEFCHLLHEKGEESRTQHIAYSASQLFDPEELPADQVFAYMTVDPVTARPATRITELAGKMVDAHIHRIVVVDDENRPIGVVSSTDILAAVARHRTGGKPSIRSDPLLQNEEVDSCTQTLH